LNQTVYQKIDQAYVDIRNKTLENEIKQVIAEGEAVNVFQDVAEGMLFRSIFKNKSGKILSSQPPT
jgi:hypothetical protein